MRRNSLSSRALECIFEVINVGGIAFSRGSLIRKLQQLDAIKDSKWRANKLIKNLQSGGYIKQTGDKIKLTTRGISHIKYLEYRKLDFVPHYTHWDKAWRIIFFDIPEQKRHLRKLLREKIKEWKCVQIQQSVFATPFDCEKEIEKLAEILEVGSGVRVVKAIHASNDLAKNLRKIFKV